MENQPTGQTTEQAVEQPQPMGQTVGQPPVEQSSSATIWYIVLAAVVVIGLGFLYFVTNSPVTYETAPDAQTSTEQTQIPAPTEGNTTADISADLNQIQDSSAALDADSTASSNEIQSL